MAEGGEENKEMLPGIPHDSEEHLDLSRLS